VVIQAGDRVASRSLSVRVRLFAAMMVAFGLLGLARVPVARSAVTARSSARAAAGSDALGDGLLGAVRSVGFDQVIDFGPEGTCPGARFCAFPARPIARPPNVDVAVIELDPNGRPIDAADVLLSRDYPDGVLAPVDRDLGTTAVRFLRWNINRSNGGTFSTETGRQLTREGWADDPPLTRADDIVPGREDAPLRFMEPYPASLFKLMIAFQTLRLVDRGVLRLDARYTYVPVTSPCLGASPKTETNRQWLQAMITYSDDGSACALVQQLQHLGQITAMNQEFRALGLGTLQVNDTDPASGGNWQPGDIDMTSLDTARLLLLINGGPGTLWHASNGQPVTANLLSPGSRAFLTGLLAQQGFNDELSTTNWCGLPYPAAGIPQLVAAQWINPRTGTVTVAGKRYGRDVRPCNAAAQVTFAHKTGFSYNYASDAGIVQSLPGRPYRHYIVAFISNLGYRYSDPQLAAATTLPCFGVPGICYTQKIAQLGYRIDTLLKTRQQPT
jgi:Beta-lactamase enzyme family